MASLFTAGLKADSTSSTSCLLHDTNQAKGIASKPREVPDYRQHFYCFEAILLPRGIGYVTAF